MSVEWDGKGRGVPVELRPAWAQHRGCALGTGALGLFQSAPNTSRQQKLEKGLRRSGCGNVEFLGCSLENLTEGKTCKPRPSSSCFAAELRPSLGKQQQQLQRPFPSSWHLNSLLWTCLLLPVAFACISFQSCSPLYPFSSPSCLSTEFSCMLFAPFASSEYFPLPTRPSAAPIPKVNFLMSLFLHKKC